MNKISNLIIPEWDKRYGKLGHIYKKYNYNNIRKKFGKSLCWFIPPELVITTWYNDNDTEVKSINDYDSNNIYSNWVYGTSFNKILLKVCNLTQQEYYDLVVDHRNDRSTRPRCDADRCNALVPYQGRLDRGYGSSTKDLYFCCRGCQNEYQIKDQYNHLDKYENTRKRLIKGGDNLNTLNSKIKRLRSGFISYGDPNDICSLYIAKTKSGKFKFGAAKSIDIRFGLSSHDDQYLKYKILYKDTRLKIANLEALIKYERNDASEYLEFKGLMFDFRSAYLKALHKLINNEYSFD